MATHPQTPFRLPPGRMVSGDLHTLQTTVFGKPQEKKEKPNKFFAVAIDKNMPQIAGEPHFNEAWQIIYSTAITGYMNVPNVRQQIEQGLAAAKFAWKIEDGDAPDNAGKEGFAGCWIVKFSTTLLEKPSVCDMNNNPVDPASIKRGWYIEVHGSVGINGNTDHTAGVYLNPNGVRLAGYGKEIVSGLSPEQMFGSSPARLAAGASATPLTPAGAMPGSAPLTTAPMQQAALPAPSVMPAGNPGLPGASGPAALPTATPTLSVPAGAAPLTAPLLAPATASLSNPPAVTPNPAVLQPAPAPTPTPVKSLAQQIAEANGQVHHPGWRYIPEQNQYVQDPTSTAAA